MNKRQLSNLRKKARNMVVRGLSCPVTYCNYCERAIVWRELVHPSRIIEETYETITVVIENKHIKLRKATVDHIIPLNRGGSNKLINLAHACFRCNFEKDGFVSGKCRGCNCQLTASDFKRRCIKCTIKSNGLNYVKALGKRIGK